VSDEPIYAVALVTRREAALLGATFDRLWPVEDAECFSDLLKAIDQADRQLQGGGDPEQFDLDVE
jgi:hypothetical protein